MVLARLLACPVLFFLSLNFIPSVFGKPKLTLLIAEREYQTETTLPGFADQFLSKDFIIEYSTAPKEGTDRHHLLNPQAIERAELLFISVRRRAFSNSTMDSIRRHLSSGKPVIGIRTASHAFELRKESPLKGHQQWPEWDQSVIGGNYQGHHGKGKVCLVNNLSSSSNHPILKKVNLPIRTPASLYRNSPLPKASTPVLIGTIPNHSPEPVAWTHITPAGSRIFYTSLGHPQDFENPNFNQLLRNAINWCLERD